MRLTRTIQRAVRLSLSATHETQAEAVAYLMDSIKTAREMIQWNQTRGTQLGSNGFGAAKERGGKAMIVGVSRDTTNEAWINALDWLEPRVRGVLETRGGFVELRAAFKG